jgi:putative protease
MKAPELLLPAGSLHDMRAAYNFGSDAVYAGQPRYSLRARTNECRLEQIAEVHQRGKQFFESMRSCGVATCSRLKTKTAECVS